MEVEQAAKKRIRGKLYRLTDDSKWDDQGTGFISIVSAAEGRRLLFQDEVDGKVLHDRQVWQSDAYHMQGDTIIVWEDLETQQDWALSFQDAADIVSIWNALRRDKRLLRIPAPGTLAELARALTFVPPAQREALANECIADDFIAGLRSAFRMAEDAGDETALILLWRIAKGSFLLCSQRLSERYLQPDLCEDVFGILEWDEGLPMEKRIAHRQVHSLQVHFNQVVAFEDGEVLARIHLIFRLQYVKDIVLPRLMDDGAVASMTQMVQSNLLPVLGYLQKNDKMLEALFGQIRQGDLQSLLFLQEACRLAKQVPTQRQGLHERLFACGLFDVLVPFLRDAARELASPAPLSSEACAMTRPRWTSRVLAMEILYLSAQCDPVSVRALLCSEEGGGQEVLHSLIRILHEEPDQGLQGQACELLRIAMDPTGLEGGARDQCLGTFYERAALMQIVCPLRDADRLKSNPSAAYGVQLACELLSFTVINHGFKAKAFVTRQAQLAEHLCFLVSADQHFVRMAPIRLIRTMVATKDDLYWRFIARNGLMAPVLSMLQKHTQPPSLGGGGAFASATIALLDTIRQTNAKVLIDHLVRMHRRILVQLAPRCPVIDSIIKRHLQNIAEKNDAMKGDAAAAAAPTTAVPAPAAPTVTAHVPAAAAEPAPTPEMPPTTASTEPAGDAAQVGDVTGDSGVGTASTISAAGSTAAPVEVAMVETLEPSEQAPGNSIQGDSQGDLGEAAPHEEPSPSSEAASADPYLPTKIAVDEVGSVDGASGLEVVGSHVALAAVIGCVSSVLDRNSGPSDSSTAVEEEGGSRGVVAPPAELPPTTVEFHVEGLSRGFLCDALGEMPESTGSVRMAARLARLMENHSEGRPPAWPTAAAKRAGGAPGPRSVKAKGDTAEGPRLCVAVVGSGGIHGGAGVSVADLAGAGTPTSNGIAETKLLLSHAPKRLRTSESVQV